MMWYELDRATQKHVSLQAAVAFAKLRRDYVSIFRIKKRDDGWHDYVHL